MMEHLFQDLYGVDAPAHWEAYSAPPNPITGNTGLNGRVLRGGRNGGDYGRTLQKGKAREKLKGNGKGGGRE